MKASDLRKHPKEVIDAEMSKAADLMAGVYESMGKHETPHLDTLRNICEEIGYGRVLQVVSDWFDETHPGMSDARVAIAVGRYMRELKQSR